MCIFADSQYYCLPDGCYRRRLPPLSCSPSPANRIVDYDTIYTDRVSSLPSPICRRRYSSLSCEIEVGVNVVEISPARSGVYVERGPTLHRGDTLRGYGHHEYATCEPREYTSLGNARRGYEDRNSPSDGSSSPKPSLGCKISYLCLDHHPESQGVSTASPRSAYDPGKEPRAAARSQDRRKDIAVVRRSEDSTSSGTSSSSSTSSSSKSSFLEMIWGRRTREKRRLSSDATTATGARVAEEVRPAASSTTGPVSVQRSPAQRPSVRARRPSSQRSAASVGRKDGSDRGSRGRGLSVAVTARGILEANSRDRRAAQQIGTRRVRVGSSTRRPARQGGEREVVRGRQASGGGARRERGRDGSYERRRPREAREMRVEGMVRGREEITRAFLDV